MFRIRALPEGCRPSGPPPRFLAPCAGGTFRVVQGGGSPPGKRRVQGGGSPPGSARILKIGSEGPLRTSPTCRKLPE
eukprot:11992939-Alexandrium_andersonii.AAC.1